MGMVHRPQAVRNRMRLQIRMYADLRTRYASSVLKRCFKTEIVLLAIDFQLPLCFFTAQRRGLSIQLHRFVHGLFYAEPVEI